MNQQFGIPLRLRGFVALVLGAALCLVFAGTALAETHTVNPGDSIQAAIDAAAAGDTIQIAAGTYEQNIVVNKHVKLVGAGNTTIIRRATAGGAAITVTASGTADDYLLLKDLRIEPASEFGIDIPGTADATAATVRYLRVENVQVVGDATHHTENERCFNVGPYATIEHLDIQGSAFNACDHGLLINKQYSPPDDSYANNISVRNTTFTGNGYKGIYAEKLSNALFENITVSNNGSDPNWNQAWNAGIDINLKAGDYQNLTFRNMTVTGNGKTYANGVGLTIKARDDASSYNTYPATLDNVLIEGGAFTGNEHGIRIGETGKLNAGPTNVVIHGAAIHSNVATYSGADKPATGDLLSYTQAPINASGNSWGTSGSTIFVAPGAGAVDSTVLVRKTPCNDLTQPTFAYCTIQAAVNAAPVGSTIDIGPGLYEERVTLGKRVRLVGVGSDMDPVANTVIRFSNAVVISTSDATGIETDPLLLENLRVEVNGVHNGIQILGNVVIRHLHINNVKVIGTITTPEAPHSCFYLTGTSSLEYFDVQDSAFEGCRNGWSFNRASDLTPTYARFISVRNTAFRNNVFRAAWIEKLSDAEFVNVSVVDNGTLRQTSDGFGASGGLLIRPVGQQEANNLTFRNLTVTGNGFVTNPVTADRVDSGLLIQPITSGYGANYGLPSVANVLIEGGTFVNNKRNLDLNATNVHVHGASIHGSGLYDLKNYNSATVDATGNWWGQATGPAAGKIVKSPGDVLYEPFLTSAPSSATLVVPDALYRIPNGVDKITVPVRFNPGSESLAALAFSLDYAEACLTASEPTVARGSSLLERHRLSVGAPPSGSSYDLDFAVTYVPEFEGQPLLALLPGTLVEVEFTIADTCRTDGNKEIKFFAHDNVPSFGTTGGASASGTTQDGVVTLDFNQDATNFTLDGNRGVYEGQTSGVVGTFNVEDPDGWETFTYVMDPINSLFQIVGNELRAVGPFNYDTAQSHTVTVKATGSGGTEIERTFTVIVIPPSTLSLPSLADGLHGLIGSQVSVPVNIARNGNAVIHAKFIVGYDAACLNFDSISGGWTGTATENSGSVLVDISGAALAADGALVNLVFNVTNACAAYPTQLTFVAPTELSDAQGRVSARTTNGVLFVIKNDPRGDCNWDGKVDAGDFSAVVLENFDGDGNFWLDAPKPTFHGSPQGCDANTEKVITIADLTCTVNVVFGHVSCTEPHDMDAAAAAATPAALALGRTAANGYIDLPVTFRSNGYAVAAAAFVVNYDPALYTLDMADADQDGIPDAVTFHTPANIMRWAIVDEAGKLKIAAAGLQLPLPALADGPIATVRLQAKAGADGAVGLSDASLGGTDGFGVPVTVSGPGGAAAAGSLYLPAINR